MDSKPEAKKSPTSSKCSLATPSQILDCRNIENENGITRKKPSLARLSKEKHFSGTAKTRNGYVNFMNEYRKDHKGLVPSQVMIQAASCWKRLSEEERCQYKAHARNAKYTYNSKNKTLNKALSALKRSIGPKEINVIDLIKASRQIQVWKAEVIKNIWLHEINGGVN